MSRHRPRDTAQRLLAQLAILLGPGMELIMAHEREWASATFSGARHSFAIRLPLSGAAAPAPMALTQAPDHEFELPGAIVADCAVTVQQRTRDSAGQHWLDIQIELLTVVAD